MNLAVRNMGISAQRSASTQPVSFKYREFSADHQTIRKRHSSFADSGNCHFIAHLAINLIGSIMSEFHGFDLPGLRVPRMTLG
jgi:hypothetical protein